MEGLGLLQTLVEATGLPKEYAEKEFNRILNEHQITPENLTLEQVRMVLAELLQDVLLEAKENLA